MALDMNFAEKELAARKERIAKLEADQKCLDELEAAEKLELELSAAIEARVEAYKARHTPKPNVVEVATNSVSSSNSAASSDAEEEEELVIDYDEDEDNEEPSKEDRLAEFEEYLGVSVLPCKHCKGSKPLSFFYETLCRWQREGKLSKQRMPKTCDKQQATNIKANPNNNALAQKKNREAKASL
jgi:hypothetical protein